MDEDLSVKYSEKNFKYTSSSIYNFLVSLWNA